MEDTRAKRQELEDVVNKRAWTSSSPRPRFALRRLFTFGRWIRNINTIYDIFTERFVAQVKAEKERARAARELEQRRERSAVRLQAWWRGIMVRSCLGQFRKNKVLRTKLMKIQKDRAKNAAKANK